MHALDLFAQFYALVLLAVALSPIRGDDGVESGVISCGEGGRARHSEACINLFKLHASACHFANRLYH